MCLLANRGTVYDRQLQTLTLRDQANEFIFKLRDANALVDLPRDVQGVAPIFASQHIPELRDSEVTRRRESLIMSLRTPNVLRLLRVSSMMFSKRQFLLLGQINASLRGRHSLGVCGCAAPLL